MPGQLMLLASLVALKIVSDLMDPVRTGIYRAHLKFGYARKLPSYSVAGILNSESRSLASSRAHREPQPTTSNFQEELSQGLLLVENHSESL